MLLAALLTALVPSDCFFDYVSTIAESCYFGSSNSQLALAAAYSVFIQGCDFQSCTCETPRIEPTHCDTFVLKTMIEFMGVHPHTDAPTQSLYHNLTKELNAVCNKVGPSQENEAPGSQLSLSHGACSTSSKPSTGHTTGITLYVTITSLVFTFIFFGRLEYVGQPLDSKGAYQIAPQRAPKGTSFKDNSLTN